MKRKLRDAAIAELARRQAEKAMRGELENSLSDFHRAAWPYIDPAQYVHGFHIDAICDHLQAVTWGYIRNLIITVPPRMSKSILTMVSWPAWTWAQSDIGPLAGPQVKIMGISYDPKLSVRDAIKMKRLIGTPWYQDKWSDRFHIMPDKDQNAMFENSAGGFRFSTSVNGTITGEGADIICIDDCLNAKKAQWQSALDNVNSWADEALPTRFNNPKTGARVIIMQRLHEDDLVGHELAKEQDIVHLNLPMEFVPGLDTRTYINGKTFFEDPRAEEGELLWPERFPEEVIEKLRAELGPHAFSAQMQQSPTPRGGGIIDRLWWQVWPAKGYEAPKGQVQTFPPCSLIVGSVDTAYGEKDEDAWNAMTVWGVWSDQRERPKVVLMEGWRKRVPLRGVIPKGALTDEERKPHWGLAEFVADTVRRRRIDVLLIENKTRGGDLAAELYRLFRAGECQIIMIEPQGDKVARLHSVQPMFADEMIYAPEKAWAEAVINEVSQFPKSKWKDYCLVAGTLVATRRGNVPIETVTTSDECLTPEGWRRVTACGPTGVWPVTSVRGLTGTLDHPVFTFDRGYQNLDTISQATNICRLSLCDLTRIIRLNSSLWTDAGSNLWADKENITLSNGMRPFTAPHAANAGSSQKGFMWPFGKRPMDDRFQKAVTSTTRTLTASIAALKILSAYRAACIGAYLGHGRMLPLRPRTWLKSVRLRFHGIGPRKGVRGIARMLNAVWTWLTKPSPSLTPSLAVPALGAPNQCWAETVERSSVRPVARQPNREPDGASAEVFNLTVDGGGCYFANGILVHNTDTASQALSWLRKSGALMLGTEADEDNLRRNTFRSQPQSRYDV